MNQVILSTEAEAYIQALESIRMEDVGSEKWMRQHDHIEKLNMQALCNALNNEDEFVKEFLINHDKLSMLVADLIITDLWKKKVFPKLSEAIKESKATFPFYFILYHELTVMTLLECVLYHQDSCQALDDSSFDLVDYCYSKITQLLTNGHYCNDVNSAGKEIKQTTPTTTLADELNEQNLKINFLVSLKAISILRFLIENLKNIGLSVAKRIYSTLDVPVLMVELVEKPPWVCEHKENVLKHDGSVWQAADDPLKLGKLDGQVWIALFQLLVSDLRQKYEFNSYRKSTIMKLRPRLNEYIVDQIPVLVELQRFLDQLSFYEPESAKSDLILEQLPEIRRSLLKKYKGKWGEIAENQLRDYFSVDSEGFKMLAKTLSNTYSLENLENFIPEPPKCVVCGEKAGKKCSRCQNEWYCRRECQVGHWSKHKKACDLISATLIKN